MTDDTLRTVRRRLDHVVSSLETVQDHLDDEADGRALTRVLGTLEQVEADLDELDADGTAPEPTAGS